MKQLKETSLVVIIGVFLTILLLYWLKASFVMQQDNMQVAASQFFLKAIDKETEKSREALKFFKYELGNSPDAIPYAEKMDWSDQSYLIGHDPNRLILDSLFKVELAKQRLYVPTAVRCLFEGKVVYSNSDSLFCQQAIALPPVVYRLSNEPIKRCELQGYIKLPVGTVLKQIPSIGFMVLSWVLSVFFIIGYSYYRRKRGTIVSIRVPVAEDRIVTPVQIAVEWIQLPLGLLLCKASGVLKCGDQQVLLSGNGLRLFRLFISKDDYFLTFDEIYRVVFGHKMDKKVNSDRDRIITLIKRLRENLKVFTCIEIKSVRGEGYLLEIKSAHTDESEAIPT